MRDEKTKIEKQDKKAPITQEKIFKIMFYLTVVIAAVFFLKNLLTGAVSGALLIGASIAVFSTVFLIMKKKNASESAKQFTIALGMEVLIFVIALNSGGYFSDDFIMFLAVIALTGLYLEPKFSWAQVILGAVFLSIMYILYPQKADPLPQYLQCLGEFILTGVLFIQAIKRGKAFIGISEDRAKEAEELVLSMKQMGEELETDFAKSSKRINNNTNELQRGSESIVIGAVNMQNSCDDVQDRIIQSQQSIKDLNSEVAKFENALKENQTNMASMEEQLSMVEATVNKANEVFKMMEQKMLEIAGIARQLGDISFNTTILSLNASIEAARAGEFGAGFSVVAEEMRSLSDTSNMFSEQVSEVVKDLMNEVSKTSDQFIGTTKALLKSQKSMDELEESFERLTEQFAKLYDNIENQNVNVNEVGSIFNNLRIRVEDMKNYSKNNQDSVGAIIEAMGVYKGNIEKVIEKTRME